MNVYPDDENNHKKPTNLTRRQFISTTTTTAAAGAVAVIGVGVGAAQGNVIMKQQNESADQPVEGANDDGKTTDPAPDEITDDTLVEASKVAALAFTADERKLMLPGIRRAAAGYQERRARKLPNGLLPAPVFDPRLPRMKFDQTQQPVVRSNPGNEPFPDNDDDIAFASITRLARWIETRKLSSTRLTEIYLERLKKFGPILECVITLTEDRARKQAKQADAEIKSGKYRGPLHGIPYGAKDLFDTANIPTTYGATPYRNRVPDSDAAVIRKLNEAGAVLVAKTTMGALAYGDIWFGGRTRNPFNLKQGSSGSSAGSAAGTSAGLFGFSIGTETLGSIVSPSTRCGATGLRPTFGRVARTGAMALCWSLDKIGPICRTVEDCALILDAIRGSDPGDACAVDLPFNFNANQSLKGRRIGYVSQWFESRRATDIDRHCLELIKRSKVEMVPLEFPEFPYGELITILNVEAAAAFEELTLSNRDDELVWQDPQAWPNSFRQSWFVPAIELIQAERLRRQVCEVMAEQFTKVDAIVGPSFAGAMLLITNNTGHPSITFRSGFRSNNRPTSFTIWGNLYDEGTICRLAIELEKQLDVWRVRPELKA